MISKKDVVLHTAKSILAEEINKTENVKNTPK